MKRKVCVRSMVLGAGILALGIIIGQWVTPDIEAQNNGVFDEIRCTQLTVVNQTGEPVINLKATQDGGTLGMMDKTRKISAILSIERKNPSLHLSNKKQNASVSLVVDENGGGLLLSGNKMEGSVLLSTHKGTGIVIVTDRHGNAVGHLPENPPE